jgi:hypothetical protein
MKELIKYAKELIVKYPDKKTEIIDFVQLCQDEIEQGGSVEHEIELCYSSLKELIKTDE